MATSFESFNDNDEEWLSGIETRDIEFDDDANPWSDPEADTPEDGEPVYEDEQATAPFVRHDAEPHARYHAHAGHPDGRIGVRTAVRPSSGRARTGPRSSQNPARERTSALIDHGRSSASRAPLSGRQKVVIAIAAGAALVTAIVMITVRTGPSWPASVNAVKSEIVTACQNPNVAAEPGQVNFACEKDTSQILWVFALMTSNNKPRFADAKTGRKGLEPITPAQGGEVAWSLNLHHPYNADNPVDSITVAARAINNIIGGATLTSSSGKPTVQPGLESKAANCTRYTGSPALVSRAGYPSACAKPVTSAAGQAALVADIYQNWVVGASAATARDAGVLFQHANDPGNPEVQAILLNLSAGQ